MTKIAIREARLKEIKKEVLNSNKLKVSHKDESVQFKQFVANELVDLADDFFLVLYSSVVFQGSLEKKILESVLSG